MREKPYRISIKYQVVIKYDEHQPDLNEVQEAVFQLITGQSSHHRPFKFIQITPI